MLTTKPLIGSARLIANHEIGRLIANRQQTLTRPYLHAANRKKEGRKEKTHNHNYTD